MEGALRQDQAELAPAFEESFSNLPVLYQLDLVFGRARAGQHCNEQLFPSPSELHAERFGHSGSGFSEP